MDNVEKRAPDRVRPVIPTVEVDAKGTRAPSTMDFEEQLYRSAGPLGGGGRTPVHPIAELEVAAMGGRAAKTIAEGRSVGDRTDALLAERGRVHGNFTDHARITQRLKAVILDELAARHERKQVPLTDEAREAIDMILHKIGRIVAGDPDFKDHWDDVSGYARLVSERCSK